MSPPVRRYIRKIIVEGKHTVAVDTSAGYSCDTSPKMLALIIYNPVKVSFKHDASSILCTLSRRRNSRPRLQYRRGRQVRTADVARLQSHLLGNHSHQVEIAEPRPAAEEAVSGRASQCAKPAGYLQD